MTYNKQLWGNKTPATPEGASYEINDCSMIPYFLLPIQLVIGLILGSCIRFAYTYKSVVIVNINFVISFPITQFFHEMFQSTYIYPYVFV
jgi:hypothetical protein